MSQYVGGRASFVLTQVQSGRVKTQGGVFGVMMDRRNEGGARRAGGMGRDDEVVAAKRDGRRDSLPRLLVVVVVLKLRLLLLWMVGMMPFPPQMKRAGWIAWKGDCERTAGTTSFQPSPPTHGAQSRGGGGDAVLGPLRRVDSGAAGWREGTRCSQGRPGLGHPSLPRSRTAAAAVTAPIVTHDFHVVGAMPRKQGVLVWGQVPQVQVGRGKAVGRQCESMRRGSRIGRVGVATTSSSSSLRQRPSLCRQDPAQRGHLRLELQAQVLEERLVRSSSMCFSVPVAR